MDNEYENIFGNFEGTEYFNLGRGQSMELDNIFCNPSGFTPRYENDYGLQLEDFKVDKSDTKSNTKYPSPPYIFETNNYFPSQPENGEMQNMNHQKLKIFNIEKDEEKKFYLKTQREAEMILNATNKLTISERMRFKKEKTKLLLGEKKKRGSDSDDVGGSNSFKGSSGRDNQDFKDNFFDENKIVNLTDKTEVLNKKEIKILRNRMSAQKSRDRRKEELDELRIYSNNLLNENDYLKRRIEETEKELNMIKRTVKNCDKCFKETEEKKKKESKSENVKNKKRSESTQNNSFITAPLRTTVVDMSSASRANYNNRMKVGVLSGFMLVLLILGCIILFPFEFKNENSLPTGRILEGLNSSAGLAGLNSSIVPYKNSKIFNVTKDSKDIDKISNTAVVASDAIQKSVNLESLIASEVVSYPLALQFPEIKSHDENLLGRKRYEFMLNMANKIKVANSINEVKTTPRKYLRNFDYYRFQNAPEVKMFNENSKMKIENFSTPYSLCLKEQEVTCDIKDESKLFSNILVPLDYHENLLTDSNKSNSLSEQELKTVEKLQDNVESILCKDYVTTSRNKDHMLDEIIRKKMDQDNNNSDEAPKDDADCLYLHMVIPSKENEKPSNKNVEAFNDEAAFEQPKMKTYYEIGCKIFEINKIYK